MFIDRCISSGSGGEDTTIDAVHHAADIARLRGDIDITSNLASTVHIDLCVHTSQAGIAGSIRENVIARQSKILTIGIGQGKITAPVNIHVACNIDRTAVLDIHNGTGKQLNRVGNLNRCTAFHINDIHITKGNNSGLRTHRVAGNRYFHIGKLDITCNCTIFHFAFRLVELAFHNGTIRHLEDTSGRSAQHLCFYFVQSIQCHLQLCNNVERRAVFIPGAAHDVDHAEHIQGEHVIFDAVCCSTAAPVLDHQRLIQHCAVFNGGQTFAIGIATAVPFAAAFNIDSAVINNPAISASNLTGVGMATRCRGNGGIVDQCTLHIHCRITGNGQRTESSSLRAGSLGFCIGASIGCIPRNQQRIAAGNIMGTSKQGATSSQNDGCIAGLCSCTQGIIQSAPCLKPCGCVSMGKNSFDRHSRWRIQGKRCSGRQNISICRIDPSQECGTVGRGSNQHNTIRIANRLRSTRSDSTAADSNATKIAVKFKSNIGRSCCHSQAKITQCQSRSGVRKSTIGHQ